MIDAQLAGAEAKLMICLTRETAHCGGRNAAIIISQLANSLCVCFRAKAPETPHVRVRSKCIPCSIKEQSKALLGYCFVHFGIS
jgi:hypothetical protein